MKWLRLLLPCVLLAGSALPAQAQLFRPRVRLTGMQVPELIAIARNDPDERRRIAAIEQLREQDAGSFPALVPNLVEIMLHDAKSGVRMEAVHSLSKIRPTTQPMLQMMAQALQQSAQHDDNWRVRFQARSTMWLHGYHAADGNQPIPAFPAPTTNEPPLAGGMAAGPPMTLPTPMPAPGTVNYVAGSSPMTYVTRPTAPTVLPRPLPSGPGTVVPGYSTAVPQRPVETPSAPAVVIPVLPPQ